MASPRDHDPYEALRYGEYRWFLAGVMAMFMGFQMQSLVMGWQVYEITHDTFALGLIGSFAFVLLTFWGTSLLSPLHHPPQ